MVFMLSKYRVGRQRKMVGLGMLGAAAFEKGGIVPNDNVLSILHAQEMVVLAHISTGLQSMISNNSTTTTGPSNQNFNWESHFDKAGDVNQQTSNKMMRKAAGHGNFPRRRN
jgi:hypothetical protein